MFQRPSMIGAVEFDTTPADEGFAAAFTTVVGTKKAVDFDYDSRDEFIYWVEFDPDKVTVRINHVYL